MKRKSLFLLIVGVSILAALCVALTVFPAQSVKVRNGEGYTITYTSLMTKDIQIVLFAASISLIVLSSVSLLILKRKGTEEKYYK